MAVTVLFWLSVCLFGSFAEASTSLSWFDLYDEKTLSGHNHEVINNINAEECARRCLVGTSTVPSGSCRSFDYDNQYGKCVLSRANKDTNGEDFSDSNPPSRHDYYHRRDSPHPCVCDFDTDLCQYTQDTTDDFDWRRNSGGTNTGDTGPPADHTTGSGRYMYIETSSPRRRGEIARLTSPTYLLHSGSQCLLFWTHMFGEFPDWV
ncbi:MAM and LDL-receptor class A domain-containing protein 1-like [Branchiostoma floridae x Branchiostoma japonicum]